MRVIFTEEQLTPMKRSTMLALAIMAVVAAPTAGFADELLGGKKGGKGGGSTPPPKTAPPQSAPPKGAPPKAAPPQSKPPQGAPPIRSGGGSDVRTGNQGAPPPRSNDGFLQGAQRRGESRSGNVSYGSVNNQPQRSPQQRGQGWNDIPSINNSRIAQDARREDRIRQVQPSYRQGYTHYSNQWRDDYFWYPHYQFGYQQDRCVPSPWYFYDHLPGYVSRNRVNIIVNVNPIWNNARDEYRYRRPSGPYDRNATGLDWAITDIEDGFESQNMRYFGRLIPIRDRIQVDLEGEWRYQMSSDDFYDLLSDIVQGTDTDKYVYLGTRFSGREALVFYAHRYRDAWGYGTETFHTWGLQQQGNGWSVTYFNSSRQDPRHWR